MEKHAFNWKISFWILLILGLTIFLGVLFSQNNVFAAVPRVFYPSESAIRAPTEVPPGYIPPAYRNVTLTATLDVWAPNFTPAPTYTPMIIGHTVDLSPSLDNDLKFEVVIKHPDGSLDRYFVGPLPKDVELDKLTLPPEILSTLPLKPGDKIMNWKPPSPYRRVQPTMVPSDTPMVYPYPVP